MKQFYSTKHIAFGLSLFLAPSECPRIELCIFELCVCQSRIELVWGRGGGAEAIYKRNEASFGVFDVSLQLFLVVLFSLDEK